MAGEKKENGAAAAEKKKGDEGKHKEENNKKNKNNGNVVVLKIDMHCEGCASKIMKYAKSVQGVEKAKVEWEASKLTVEGKVDPSKLREKLQEKTKKKVELVSPQTLPNKDKENKSDNDNNNNDKGKNNTNAKNNNKPQPEDKKPKEPPVTTAVLKLGLHCHGCVDKIHKLVSKTSGVQSVTVEMQKDLVTVTGTMDVAVLAESLKTKMKRVVEVVPQKKKEKDNKEGNNNKADKDKGKDQKEKDKEISGDAEEANAKEEAGEGGTAGGAGNNAGGGNAGGGKKKKKGGGGGGGGGGEGKEAKDENGGSSNDGGGRLMEGNRMEYFGPTGFAHTGFYGYANPLPLPPPPAIGFGYGYGPANDGAIAYYGNATPCPGYNSYGSGYGPMYADPYHAPQMFSDENPNACSVM